MYLQYGRLACKIYCTHTNVSLSLHWGLHMLWPLPWKDWPNLPSCYFWKDVMSSPCHSDRSELWHHSHLTADVIWHLPIKPWCAEDISLSPVSHCCYLWLPAVLADAITQEEDYVTRDTVWLLQHVTRLTHECKQTVCLMPYRLQCMTNNVDAKFF